MVFFKAIRLLNYPLQGLVCDDNRNIKEVCLKVYPRAIVQICTNHYKENIRRSLQVRTNFTYQPFMKNIEMLFKKKRSKEDIQKRANKIINQYGDDLICQQVLADIYKRRKELFTHLLIQGIPNTTNLIECFNSHLQSRLKTIKGFQSFKHTNLWLNGYFLKRRFKPFTDCRGKFKHLNRKMSLERSKNSELDIPSFFLINLSRLRYILEN
ncbi:hypothetical protein GYA19_03505 [Candidatus Beckwithbacteria bacterium]|nr:hypothetical protein [Candidatus Beckwithbacteria bacterium]